MRQPQHLTDFPHRLSAAVLEHDVPVKPPRQCSLARAGADLALAKQAREPVPSRRDPVSSTECDPARAHLPNDFDMNRHPQHPICENFKATDVQGLKRKSLLDRHCISFYRRKTLWPARCQGFTGRATCSPATAVAAKAGTDQASPDRRHDISINSISAAPAQ
jgi:hypothetical protein